MSTLDLVGNEASKQKIGVQEEVVDVIGFKDPVRDDEMKDYRYADDLSG